MKFRLEDIPREGREEDSEQDPNWLDERLAGEKAKRFHFGNPIRIHLRLSRSGKVVLVHSQVRAEAEFRCDRCLDPVSLVLNSENKASLKPKPKVPLDEEREPEREDLEMDFYEGEEIDLTPLIQDQLLLVLPAKVLCREDCRGLCQRCGQNFNRGTCQCAEQDVDPRLEPLKRFRV